MIRAPECVDALEARIASNIEYWTQKRKTGETWHYVSSKSFHYEGTGLTAEEAVMDFLVGNLME